jgi:hypothetical protein
MTRQASTAAAANAARFTHRNLPMLLLRAREGVLALFRPCVMALGV